MCPDPAGLQTTEMSVTLPSLPVAFREQSAQTGLPPFSLQPAQRGPTISGRREFLRFVKS